jgi:hypothetical protein
MAATKEATFLLHLAQGRISMDHAADVAVQVFTQGVLDGDPTLPCAKLTVFRILTLLEELAFPTPCMCLISKQESNEDQNICKSIQWRKCGLCATMIGLSLSKWQLGLAPASGEPQRRPYLRWLIFCAAGFEPAVADRALKREPGYPKQWSLMVISKRCSVRLLIKSAAGHICSESVFRRPTFYRFMGDRPNVDPSL